MLFAIGFVFILRYRRTLGDILAQPAVDTMLHATYYVVGHFHIVMGVAAIFGIFAATYYWFPKMFGRSMDEGLGKLHFWLTFTGVYCYFMPMHFWVSPAEFDAMPIRPAQAIWPRSSRCTNSLTIAAFATDCGAVDLFLEFLPEPARGAPASANPWNATTLEWATTSPPPRRHFRRPVPRGGLSRSPTNTACRAKQQTFCPRTFAPEGALRAERGRSRRNPAAGLSNRSDHAPCRSADVFLGAGQRSDRARRLFKRLAAARFWPWRILALSTAILLASSLTLARSRSACWQATEAGFRHGGASRQSWESFF